MTTPQEMLEKTIQDTIQSMYEFASSLMHEAQCGRLTPQEYEFGFNLRICIDMYTAKRLTNERS